MADTTPELTAQSNTDAILLAILAELRQQQLGNTPPLLPGEVELKEPAREGGLDQMEPDFSNAAMAQVKARAKRK